ncbi:MAG TPA: AraC family transcriptional regulator [Candidatus Didemnitutus sp.]|nr:AraC family transcriptional regulator [Candidatus Didemnitutus sp.]
MQPKTNIRAWTFGDALLEYYRYGVGEPDAVEPHAHESYQIGLSVDTPGEYRYRHATHRVPAGSVSVILPGERHATRELQRRAKPATYWALFLSAARWTALVPDPRGYDGHLPFFPSPVFTAPETCRVLMRLPQQLIAATNPLEQETALARALVVLARHASPSGGADRTPAPADSRPLDRVRELLEDDFAVNHSLAVLGALAGLSPWHLCRAFRQRFGLAPHRYQLQVRLREAKKLLVAGHAPGPAATAVGFADQSHFYRHFARVTGTTPGHYLAGTARTYNTAGRSRAKLGRHL